MVESESNPVSTIRGLTHGRGVDIGIEAVGKPQTWQWAVDMVRRGGTVNFFGGCPNDSKVSLDTALLHYSEITCRPASTIPRRTSGRRSTWSARGTSRPPSSSIAKNR